MPLTFIIRSKEIELTLLSEANIVRYLSATIITAGRRSGKIIVALNIAVPCT